MTLKSKISLAVLALTAGSAAMAQLAYNVGVVSDYRYRGISQTKNGPALQGGVDFAHASGFYVGAWASTIEWIKEAGKAASPPVDTKGSVELDLYGGYKGTITKDFAYDVGYLRYEYVGNTYDKIPGNKNANTDEAYGALTYGPLTFKYSYAFSNLFGYADSKGSTYADLSATFDLGNGFTFVPHIGAQDIKGAAGKDYSYTDIALTLGKDFGKGITGTLAYIDTSKGDYSGYNVNGKKIAKDTVVLGVKYSF
ncbi:MAG: TorF family putative porin [Curvibacter sp.]|jgi:uncharacterized protein (TIGR02001 family)|nr:hypothetical protein [Curvibacter sp.]